MQYIISYIPYFLPGTLYLRLTKQGKIQSNRKQERATRFGSEQDAQQYVGKAPGLNTKIIPTEDVK